MLEMFKSSVKCVFGTQLKEGVKCVCRVYCFYTRSLSRLSHENGLSHVHNALVTRRLAKVSMTSPIIIDLTGWRNKVFFCSVVGKFEYRKKFDVNVCKQISSLYVNGKPEDVLKLKLLVAGCWSIKITLPAETFLC